MRRSTLTFPFFLLTGVDSHSVYSGSTHCCQNLQRERERERARATNFDLNLKGILGSFLNCREIRVIWRVAKKKKSLFLLFLFLKSALCLPSWGPAILKPKREVAWACLELQWKSRETVLSLSAAMHKKVIAMARYAPNSDDALESPANTTRLKWFSLCGCTHWTLRLKRERESATVAVAGWTFAVCLVLLVRIRPTGKMVIACTVWI